ncbi:flagellar protein FlaG [Oceanobacillus halotolerans]|uniref:flagellar protein FlaG n=1 Tax=Oceanobacillus halotolerans TaxID=2663380 RepID=UPI0013DAF917|nr:flagellar protein FlaG [Oceanobacillus halotolerans]
MRLDEVKAGSHPLQQIEQTKQIVSDQAKKKTNEDDKDQSKLVIQQEPKTETAQDVVSKLNEMTEPIRTNLKFELHEKLEEYYVTVIDSKTDEVIKEIPPKKMLDMYAAMAEFAGFLVDEKV